MSERQLDLVSMQDNQEQPERREASERLAATDELAFGDARRAVAQFPVAGAGFKVERAELDFRPSVVLRELGQGSVDAGVQTRQRQGLVETVLQDLRLAAANVYYVHCF